MRIPIPDLSLTRRKFPQRRKKTKKTTSSTRMRHFFNTNAIISSFFLLPHFPFLLSVLYFFVSLAFSLRLSTVIEVVDRS